jgi:hypothetical protein
MWWVCMVYKICLKFSKMRKLPGRPPPALMKGHYDFKCFGIGGRPNHTIYTTYMCHCEDFYGPCLVTKLLRMFTPPIFIGGEVSNLREDDEEEEEEEAAAMAKAEPDDPGISCEFE